MAVSSVTASTKARSSFLNDFKAAVELGAAKEGQAISTYLRSQSNSLLKQWEKLASAKLDTDERPLSEYMFETFVNRILSNHMGKAELETLRQRYYNTFLPIVWMSDEQRKRLHGSPNREGSTDRWGIRVLKATRSVDGVGEVAHLIDKEVIGPWNTNDTSRALSNLADISFVFYCRYEDWPQSHQQAFLPTMCNLYDLRNAIACEVTDVHNLEYSVGDFQHLAKMAHFDHLSHVLALVGVSRCAQIAWTRKAKGNWVTHQQGANAGVARCFLESPNPIYSLVALRAGMNLSIGLEKPSTM
ncbi:MAG: hypothetical protein JSR78_10015, partial [Proteobacteria bacterium]|nr:hypothetical protein [Pseudomonadota bacterium]